MWGDSIGDSFGAGGLGLSGIGQGGGGRGEGIGLGSIGTIGHGGGSLPRKARSASGTNNQIADVDEADIVKTMEQGAGQQFDPELIEVFLSSLDVMRSIQQRYPDRED